MTRTGRKDALTGGAMAGGTSGAIIFYLEYVSHLMGDVHMMTGYDIPGLFICSIFTIAGNPAFLFMGTLVCMITGAAVALGRYEIAVYNENKSTRINSRKDDLSFGQVMILMMIAVTIVPFISAMTLYGGGVVKDEPPSYSYTIAMDAARLDNETVLITMLGGEGKLRLDENMPFLIFIDGKNIYDSGISVTPENGTGTAAGWSVRCSGWLMVADTQVHIEVIANFKDGVSQKVFEEYV